jgi:glycosyltransferase involved in cell wall biosynthesis
MKVLHVITGLDAGGAETQLAMLLRHSRHECDVVTLYNPGPIADQIRAEGTTVRDIGMQSNRDLRALMKLRSLIARGRYDAVHAHLYRSQVYARPAARLAGTPVVVTTEHSIGETHIERRRMTAGVRGLYLASELFSDRTIAVSEVVRDRLVRWGVPAQKITVIPNGLDTAALAFDPDARARARAQLGIAADAFVIGTLGRLDPNKRIDMVIEAAAPLLGDRCALLIVGRGEGMDAAKAAAAKAGVANRVIFAGFQPDTAAMLAALDLYVMASVQETFGLAALEAMASGLPVLYTTCPALDGVSTKQARQVEGTVPALRAEFSDAVMAGPQPREPDITVFERYGIGSTVQRIDDLYERLWRERSKRRGVKRDVKRGAE